MQNQEKQYTVSVFTENKVGLLSRITVIFTRRKINIDSLTVSESETKGIFRFTIVIHCLPENIDKIVKQLEKQVEVLKSFYYEDKDVIFQEMALYKMPPTAFSENGGMLEHLVRRYNARILSIEPEFIVIEKTGHEEETQALLEELKPYGILSFVRSGRIAIAKPMKRLSVHLEELEAVTVYD